MNKRPTRLPEAEFFSFTPAVAATAPEGWRLRVLGSEMDPTDVLGAGGAAAGPAAVFGGSPHLRGVEAVSWSRQPAAVAESVASAAPPPGFTVVSLDVPVVSVGTASPFPTPRASPPDMSLGVHYNIQNNIWNTKRVGLPHHQLQSALEPPALHRALICVLTVLLLGPRSYILWYPFNDEDKHIRSRFEMRLH